MKRRYIMKEKSRHKQKRNWEKIILLIIIAMGIAVIGVVKVCGKINRDVVRTSPEELLVDYMNHIPKQEYEEMYAMLDIEASDNISKEDFIKRNSAIYEGIDMKNMKLEIISYDEKEKAVTYYTSFDTVAGNISFKNVAVFQENETDYKLVWQDSLIFPDLCATDNVKVSVTQAKRGEILDRNGRVLAGAGIASSVGIVPKKLKNREKSIKKIAELLEIDTQTIEEKLSAQWVDDESFVPIMTVPKIKEIEFIRSETDNDISKEKERQDKLMEIPGIMISDTEIREYPLGEAAAHLIGYVASVDSDDLKEHADEGYTVGSVIGRSGIEALFEERLRGRNGYRIYIADITGKVKKELACIPVLHRQNVQLTIDANLQTYIYEQFKTDKGCSVAINQYTGEVLALVSTPSYDNNDFIMGLSDAQWTELNEDENKPLYNRFRQVWCPGSTLKPVVAAIGLESEAIDPLEDYGNEGVSWQKDESWGSYYITTLHTYTPVILENALIYSDNIYFAKAALRIGAKDMEEYLMRLGFNKDLPFEMDMEKSQYSNTENIETEIQLADSGYGQGEILVNPLHIACIYSAFCNEGNMIKPRLLYQKDVPAEYWIKGAFKKEVVSRVQEGMKKVVSNSDGTGYAAYRDDVALAGKTGTAEIKTSKDDDLGTELGWFAIFTTEKTVQSPILLVSMVEDVKGRGGSGYVVEKDKKILEAWFHRN